MLRRPDFLLHAPFYTSQEAAAPNNSDYSAAPDAGHLLRLSDSTQCTLAPSATAAAETFHRAKYGESHPNVPERQSSVVPVPPPCVEGPLPHFSERTVLPLGLDDDKDYCNASSTYIRSELVEVFRASGEDVASRIHNKRIVYHQVGIRCKFCAHLPRSERRRRSATFPSSLSRLHQGVSMMVREHFMDCKEVPESVKEQLNVFLRGGDDYPAQRSRTYWLQAARKLGLIDTPSAGLMFHREREIRQHQLNFIDQDDREGVPDFLYFLMSQYRRIYLAEIDRDFSTTLVSLPVGAPGLGCRHCCEMGPIQSHAPNRYFPSKVRHISNKVNQMYNHIQQCNRCPQDIKDCIALLRDVAQRKQAAAEEDEATRAFFFRIFVRIQGDVPTGAPVTCAEESTPDDGIETCPA